jgi:hypothetical protein
MADQPTDVPGIRLRKIRGQRYLVIQVGQAFGGNTPIVYIAERVRLQPLAVLQALLNYASNSQVVRNLYDDQIPHGGAPFPGLAAARRELRSAAESLYFSNIEPTYNGQPTFYQWDVLFDRTIVLPFANGFQDVMREATIQRQRQTRLAVVRPVFAALDRELAEMRARADALEYITRVHQALVKRAAGDVALLEALDGLLGILLQFPAEAVDGDDRRDMEGLRRNLDTLRAQARLDLIENPVDSFLAGLLRDQARSATELRGLVENSTFVTHVRELVETLTTENTRTLVPEGLWRELQDTLLPVFRALLSSPEADIVISNHVQPMLQALASLGFDLTGLTAPKKPDFDAAVRQAPVAPPSSSVLVMLTGVTTVAGITTSLVGNYPGPNTLLVSIMEWSAPILLGRVVGQVQNASRLAGLMYRAIVNSASLDTFPRGAPLRLADRVALIEAINDGDLQPLQRVNWSSRFMNSTAWGSVVGVCGVICLAAAIQADDANTVRYWANIVASGSTAALGISVAAGNYFALIREGIVRGVTGKMLGAVGAAAVIVSGTLTAIEEYESGDFRGMGAAIATAAGGAFSLAGFLIAAGGGTAWSGVGLGLMVVGVVIGVAAAIYSFFRSITTAGSQEVFESYLAHFARTAGPYQEAAATRASLRQAFRTVQTGQHGVDFWDAHTDKIPQVYDLGFGFEGDNEAIQKIVDEDDEAFIRTKLRQAKPPRIAA